MFTKYGKNFAVRHIDIFPSFAVYFSNNVAFSGKRIWNNFAFIVETYWCQRAQKYMYCNSMNSGKRKIIFSNEFLCKTEWTYADETDGLTFKAIS
jgi:hypothetical protein